MGRYAEGTATPIERSKGEIERLITRFGARRFSSGWNDDGLSAWVAFEVHGRAVQFAIDMPPRGDPQFSKTPSGRQRRSESLVEDAWEAELRRRWRGLCLLIKAKLVAISEGVTEFEDEFLGHIVGPNGRTLGQEIRPHLDQLVCHGLPQLPAPPTTPRKAASR